MLKKYFPLAPNTNVSDIGAGFGFIQPLYYVEKIRNPENGISRIHVQKTLIKQVQLFS